MMSAQDRAAELLADLEAKAQSNLDAVRSRAAEIKSRLDSGMLNLQSQGSQGVASADDVPADLNWDLETEAAAETSGAREAPPAEELEDFRITAPEPATSFKDELDVATDELGIPLGD
ncbi:MAG: hypothetical protein ACRENA_05325 [Vulcanimicrobiaceae bacterium]